MNTQLKSNDSRADKVCFFIARSVAVHSCGETGYAMQLAESGGEDRRDLAKAEMEAVRRRYDELDRIVYKLLEQNALGVISDERFRVMVTGYEQEQADLTQKIAGCKLSWINATPKAVTP